MRQQKKIQQMQVVIEEEENDYDNIVESEKPNPTILWVLIHVFSQFL